MAIDQNIYIFNHYYDISERRQLSLAMQNKMDTEEFVKTIKAKMIRFAQKLVQIKSITCESSRTRR